MNEAAYRVGSPHPSCDHPNTITATRIARARRMVENAMARTRVTPLDVCAIETELAAAAAALESIEVAA